LFEAFPRGTGFADFGTLPDAPELPLAQSAAFSIDDATTTEIDDAFSVRPLPSGNVEIGIHIAAPAVAIPRGSPLDAIARSRLSTVYMPGRKITMLPDEVIGRFTLAAGPPRPALSLYVETSPDGTPIRQATRLERVPVAANLHLDAIGEQFAGAASPSDPRWTDELRALWRLAKKLESARGKSDPPRVDYTFVVDWEAAPDGRVAIAPRPRGSPLDKLIAELMIHVNSSWGKLLHEANAPGLYRTQQAGKVKMSTKPEPHQGLGVAHYLWASSPLRRYSDLVNQRQLIAAVAGDTLPYVEGDAELFAVLGAFEVTYAQYAEFQSRMEHYWCLRWLEQERVREATASVVRDNLVRFDGLPLYVRVADLPAAAAPRVRLAIGAVDLLAATVEVHYVGGALD
jgi:exoribonuclease-2